MSRGRVLAVGIVALLAGAAALAFFGGVPNPFDPPGPPGGIEIVDSDTRELDETRDGVEPPDPFAIPKPADDKPGLPGWVDPFQIPHDLAPKPPLPPGTLPGWVDPDWSGYKMPPDAGTAERDAIRARRLALFNRDSPFPANPPGDSGLFRFDLQIVQFLDSSRAKGKFTQYVNSRDGSIALLEPERVLQALGGRPIPEVALAFVLLRPGGNALVCGKHKDFGEACIKGGGDMSVGDGLLLDYTGAMSWFNSIARTPQSMPATNANTQPSELDRPLRGKLPEGGYLSLWHDPVASRVQTQVPWLGLGAGLFKDYRTRVNRVARVMVAEGADVDGGDVGFRLVGIQPADRSFDTSQYRIVTGFTTAGLDEARAMGLGIMTDTMQQAQEISAALRACQPDDPGRLCRRKHSEQMQQLQDDNAAQIRDWAQRHGLPVED
ncbi:hypothetical protein H0E84_01530 [Luteimonas sp. SJ-92]|uniref:Uncharacterized protein n=1 Tax=Luteimonas salinisoli TaxID=2752307 RepID=A0A853J7F3_9GAMM|nr:hypothetical protein [Luteimonas salinisoli]NZA25056.1 hypothetical protein [Luteimonas salinisoli]